MADRQPPHPAQFNVFEEVAAFPDTAISMLLDRYLVDHATASARIFRVYRPTPAHLHRHSDEHLYVLSGEGTFWMEHPDNVAPFAPGTFLFFPRNTPHAMPELGDGPVVFLAIDTPRRNANDIVFLDAVRATPADFIQPVR